MKFKRYYEQPVLEVQSFVSAAYLTNSSPGIFDLDDGGHGAEDTLGG